jgi:hypothetical protein
MFLLGVVRKACQISLLQPSGGVECEEIISRAEPSRPTTPHIEVEVGHGCQMGVFGLSSTQRIF